MKDTRDNLHHFLPLLLPWLHMPERQALGFNNTRLLSQCVQVPVRLSRSGKEQGEMHIETAIVMNS